MLCLSLILNEDKIVIIEMVFFRDLCSIQESGWPSGYRYMPSNQASVVSSPTHCKYLTLQRKAMGNHPCEKFAQQNYNGEDTLHSNRSESSMALKEQDVVYMYI